MKKFLLIALTAVAVVVAVAQSRVSVSFRNCDDLAMRGLLGVMNGYQITATVHTDSLDARFFEMWLVKSHDGKLSRRLIGFTPVQKDSTEICFTVMAVDSLNAWLSVDPCGGHRTGLNIPTFNCLLIECVSRDGYAAGDTIPLMAYSPGRATKYDLGNGLIADAYDICGVRNSCLHPKKWYSEFGISDLYYIEAIPVREIDYRKLTAGGR